ncbi:hypothetical protein CALCODRAFT_538849, partial [Calocera cornea HHB12733]
MVTMDAFHLVAATDPLPNTIPWLYCKCGLACALLVSNSPGTCGALFFPWVKDIASAAEVGLDGTVVPPGLLGHVQCIPKGVRLADAALMVEAREKVWRMLPACVHRREWHDNHPDRATLDAQFLGWKDEDGTSDSVQGTRTADDDVDYWKLRWAALAYEIDCKDDRIAGLWSRLDELYDRRPDQSPNGFLAIVDDYFATEVVPRSKWIYDQGPTVSAVPLQWLYRTESIQNGCPPLVTDAHRPCVRVRSTSAVAWCCVAAPKHSSFLSHLNDALAGFQNAPNAMKRMALRGRAPRSVPQPPQQAALQLMCLQVGQYAKVISPPPATCSASLRDTSDGGGPHSIPGLDQEPGGCPPSIRSASLNLLSDQELDGLDEQEIEDIVGVDGPSIPPTRPLSRPGDAMSGRYVRGTAESSDDVIVVGNTAVVHAAESAPPRVPNRQTTVVDSSDTPTPTPTTMRALLAASAHRRLLGIPPAPPAEHPVAQNVLHDLHDLHPAPVIPSQTQPAVDLTPAALAPLHVPGPHDTEGHGRLPQCVRVAANPLSASPPDSPEEGFVIAINPATVSVSVLMLHQPRPDANPQHCLLPDIRISKHDVETDGAVMRTRFGALWTAVRDHTSMIPGLHANLDRSVWLSRVPASIQQAGHKVHGGWYIGSLRRVLRSDAAVFGVGITSVLPNDTSGSLRAFRQNNASGSVGKWLFVITVEYLKAPTHWGAVPRPFGSSSQMASAPLTIILSDSEDDGAPSSPQHMAGARLGRRQTPGLLLDESDGEDLPTLPQAIEEACAAAETQAPPSRACHRPTDSVTRGAVIHLEELGWSGLLRALLHQRLGHALAEERLRMAETVLANPNNQTGYVQYRRWQATRD